MVWSESDGCLFVDEHIRRGGGVGARDQHTDGDGEHPTLNERGRERETERDFCEY
jgi:hypothetical protein